MPDKQPTITSANGNRSFACSAAAVLVFIINEKEEILMLSHPNRKGWWEVVNGALDAEETILEGALRETREETGPNIRVKPLGIIHASTFHYDEDVRYMISLCYLMRYRGGPILPGDDMAGSEARWWSLTDLLQDSTKIIVPPNQKWIFGRAVELYRLWKDKTVVLQLDLDLTAKKNKYDL